MSNRLQKIKRWLAGPESHAQQFANAQEQAKIFKESKQKIWDDDIVQMVENGIDPFKSFIRGDMSVSKRLLYKLLQIESVRTDPRISVALPDNIKEEIKEHVLQTARPFFDVEGFDYYIVEQIIKDTFYDGVLDYDNTKDELLDMAQNVGKIRKTKGWPVALDVYNIASVLPYNMMDAGQDDEFIDI